MNNDNKKQPIYIGAAWPYANGSLHLGHVAALIGGDILARYYRLAGHPVLYVSGSDCHGTPIAVAADKYKTTPKEISNKFREEFCETLIKGLQFDIDLYTKTSTWFHYEVVEELFLDLYNKGLIYKKEESLPFCYECNRFLPDRYIEGECPHCHFDNARGDQCDECGKMLDANELINPKCKICGSKPEWRAAEHFYLKLSAFQEKILKWVKESKGWRKNAYNFTLNLLEKEGLKDRAITRDLDWGVPVPIKGYESKKIYVWFEAVSGYFSASKLFSEATYVYSDEEEKDDEDKNYWKQFWLNENAKHYYVHGKDNIPFHSIIWPAILMGVGNLKLPDVIVSSEYLTLDKKQFSKSRNWAVWLPDFIKKFDSDTLRYYLIINGPENSDTDFSWLEFQRKINSGLISNVVNLAYRTLSLINKHFPDGVEFNIENCDKEDKELLNQIKECYKNVGDLIAKTSFKDSLNEVLKLVEFGNKYIDKVAPWKLIKEDKTKTAHHLSVLSQLVKNLGVLINPFLPKVSRNILKMLNITDDIHKWQYFENNFVKVIDLKPIMNRISDEDIQEEIDKLNS